MQKNFIPCVVLVANLLFGCSASNAKINVKVVDTSPPVLKTTDKTITEGDSLKVSDLYTVEDNATRKPAISIEGDFNSETDLTSLEPGEYTATIVAADNAGNSSESELHLTINKKPEPEPEPEPEPVVPETQPQVTQPQTVQPVQPQPTTPSPVQPTPAPTPDPPVQTAPTAPAITKDFLFSDGYNMQTAMPACQAFSNGYAGYSGTRSCQPLQNADGIYTGVRFTYTP